MLRSITALNCVARRSVLSSRLITASTQFRAFSGSATSNASAPAAPASSSTGQSESKQEEKKDEEKKFKIKFRHVFGVVAPFVAYEYYRREAASDFAKELNNSLVGPAEDEVKDLIDRSKLTAADIDKMREHLARTMPSGRASPDAFGKFVMDYVLAQKALANEAEAQRKLAEAEEEKRKLLAEKAKYLEEAKQRRAAQQAQAQSQEATSAAAAATTEAPAATPTAAEAEKPAETKEAEKDKDKEKEPEKENAYKALKKAMSEKFHSWDVICLVRCSPLDANGEMSIDEMLVGLSQLAQDAKPDDQHDHNPKLPARQRERRNQNRFTKIGCAWRVITKGQNRPLSYAEFEGLLSRMIRTGHFDTVRLLEQTEPIPAKFRLLSATELAERVYRDLGKRKDHDAITLDEFVCDCYSLAHARQNKNAVLWYLTHDDLGPLSFKRWRLRWLERGLRVYRQRQGGSTISGVSISELENKVYRGPPKPPPAPVVVPETSKAT